MDVAGECFQISVRLYQDRLEPTLKEVSRTLMSSVIVDRITDIEPLYRSAQIGIRCFKDQMVVVCHQAVCM